MENVIGKNFLSFFKSGDNANQPTESTQPVEPVEPINTAEPVETKEPVEPQEPTNPVELTEPVEPVEPVEPTEPAPVVDPVEPVESTEPVGPVEPTQQVQQAELTNENVLEYLRSVSNREINSIEDLLTEPEPVEDPLSGLTEETQQYIKYNKETGRGFQDFISLNTDYTKYSPLEVAQMKAIEFSDGELTMADVNDYLARELSIDLDSPDGLEKFDAIKLKNYGKDFLEQKISDQNKYKQPIEKPEAPVGPKMVTLDNGTQMTEEAYNQQVAQHNAYLEAIQRSSDNIANSSFKVKVDDNGVEKLMDLTYDYSKEDKHNMLSYSKDLGNVVTNFFTAENGEVDYKALQEGLWRANPANIGKLINSIVHKARAEWTEEMTKENLNANFNSSKKIPNAKTPSQQVPLPGDNSNYGVKFSIEQFKK